VEDDRAEVEQHGGLRAIVNCALRPHVTAGDYVLVDRGLVIERIEPEEAAAIMQMYAEMGDLLDRVDETIA
jgi:hydrogenase maturation factor